MRNMRISLWGLGLAACMAMPALASAGEPAKGPAIGDTPTTTLLGKDRKDQVIDLASYRGNKIVVMTFWASWCGPCRKELPQLEALQKRAGDKFLKVIAVNWKDELEEYRAMTRQMSGYTMTLVRDRDGTIADAYGVHSFPNLWIIDLQGKVVGHHLGYGENGIDAVIDDINKIITAELQRQQAATDAAKPAG